MIKEQNTVTSTLFYHVGGRQMGTTAICYTSMFSRSYKWLHIKLLHQ